MTAVNFDLSLFDGLQDSSGDSPVTRNDAIASLVYLNQRVDEPPALPTVSGSVSISTPFHNLAAGITSGGFTGSFNNSIGNRGVRVQDGYLSASGHMVGHGTHWEEFIGILSGTMNQTRTKYLGNDNQTPSRGIFQIAYTGGTWRFQFVQSSTTTVTFDQVTVPISQTGAPGAIPSPFYCRLLREFNTTGTGTLNLVVNDGTTTQTQTVTGVARHDDTITTNSYQFGRLNSSGIADPTIEMWWHRSLASDTFVTPGTLTSTYWASPNLNSTVSYFSHGAAAASFVDSGASDQYWHDLALHQNNGWNTLLMNGGGRIKVRVLATNSLPAGSTSGSHSGAYFALQNINEVLADPQGRYLALEWRYEPGSEWPLGMATCHITRDGIDIGSASHFPITQGATVVTLPVGNEGTSGGTLPVTPNQTVVSTLEIRTQEARFEFPYSQTRALGTKARRNYRTRWIVNATDRATLLSFFEARDGGEQTFTWTAPGDSTTTLAALRSEVVVRKLAPDAYEIAAELLEVF
jgi:phage-related protein